MVDRIKPLKLETVTDVDEYPTEVNPSEDYLVGKGIALEDSDNTRVEVVGGEVAFYDTTSGSKKVSDTITAVEKDDVPVVSVTKVLNFKGSGAIVTDAGNGQADVEAVGQSSKAPLVLMSYNGTANVGRWLECVPNIPSGDVGFIFPSAATINAISLAVNGDATVTISLYKNSTTFLTSITLTAEHSGYVTALGITVAAGDELAAKVTSGVCSKPFLAVFS